MAAEGKQFCRSPRAADEVGELAKAATATPVPVIEALMPTSVSDLLLALAAVDEGAGQAPATDSRLEGEGFVRAFRQMTNLAFANVADCSKDCDSTLQIIMKRGSPGLDMSRVAVGARVQFSGSPHRTKSGTMSILCHSLSVTDNPPSEEAGCTPSPSSSSQQPHPPAAAVCKYWRRGGKCKSGTTCTFRHHFLNADERLAAEMGR